MRKGCNKYRAVRCEYDGHKFDSMSERDFYIVLTRLKIKIIELQPRVYLTKARILYKPDFLIEEDGEEVYVDVKGMETPVFKIKKRLWKHYGIGKLRLVKKTTGHYKILEEVTCI